MKLANRSTFMVVFFATLTMSCGSARESLDRDAAGGAGGTNASGGAGHDGGSGSTGAGGATDGGDAGQPDHAMGDVKLADTGDAGIPDEPDAPDDGPSDGGPGEAGEPDVPDAAPADAGGADGGSVPACADGGAGLAGFSPSNLPKDFSVPLDVGPYEQYGLDTYCVAYTDDVGVSTCSGLNQDGGITGSFSLRPITLEGGVQAKAAYFTHFTLGVQQQIAIIGRTPLIIVSTQAIQIDGAITAGSTGGSGGVRAAMHMAGNCPDQAQKPCPGGGQPGGEDASDGRGAGGGGYCGKGGAGSVPDGGTAAPGGLPYGNQELVPLIGGASGGSAVKAGSGEGGGAIEFVSGVAISIGSSGLVLAGGGAYSNTGSGNGGGSGGAILLEAPSISVFGTLAANGGSGSSVSGTGHVGGGSEDPATAQYGGIGSGKGTVNGASGMLDPSTQGSESGGGGGAGRIRMNTCPGTIPFFGPGHTFSPPLDNQSTGCTTNGSLNWRP
jgi:hypothetical protein